MGGQGWTRPRRQARLPAPATLLNPSHQVPRGSSETWQRGAGIAGIMRVGEIGRGTDALFFLRKATQGTGRPSALPKATQPANIQENGASHASGLHGPRPSESPALTRRLVFSSPTSCLPVSPSSGCMTICHQLSGLKQHESPRLPASVGQEAGAARHGWVLRQGFTRLTARASGLTGGPGCSSELAQAAGGIGSLRPRD